MASSERIPVVIVCGSTRHECMVSSEKAHGLPIVHDLQRAAEAITGIPVAKQRVIFKGRTLCEPGSLLCEVGIEPQSRVMIVGQRSDPEQDEACRKIAKIVEKYQESMKNLTSLFQEFSGVSGGHLPRELHAQAITKQIRIGGGIAEQLVKLLEQLDALVLEQGQTEARARRKAAVQQIQAALDSVDGLQQQMSAFKRTVM